MKAVKIVYKKRPACFGIMYRLSEAEMAERCLNCRSFNECSRVGGGIEAPAATAAMPREPDTWGELEVKW